MKPPKLTRKQENRLYERFRRRSLRELERSQNVEPISSPIIEAYDKADIKRSINTKYWKEIEKFEAELFDGKDDDLEY